MSELIPYFADKTGLTEAQVQKALKTGPSRYRHFYIGKSASSRRLISSPPDELKTMQKALVDFLRPRVPIHAAAMAYQKGSSIRGNALVHAGNAALRSYDFEDFFPSLVAEDWIGYCAKRPVFDEQDDVAVSFRVLFKVAGDGETMNLAVGTSSAPFIANVLMYDFDAVVSEEVSSQGIKFTRYADDVTFSAPDMACLAIVEDAVAKGLVACGCRNLRLNMVKTNSAALPQEMAVTGLVVGGGRVGISAERKGKVIAQVQQYLAGRMNRKQIVSLKGLLAFVHGVEPEYLDVLADQFGHEAIRGIQLYQPPPH